VTTAKTKRRFANLAVFGWLFVPAANAQAYTSLAAVSFPARSTARARLTLLNGWHSEQSVFGSGDPS
jgi:hypothetical protein